MKLRVSSHRPSSAADKNPSGASSAARITIDESASDPEPAPAPKTTAQKIEEFYGVKQIGDEVIFAAQFRNAKQVLIAGDFNNWQATPMQREGDNWVLRLPIGPGVYHYAFRSATGTWFVPSSTPGRRDDGMGGHVAVLMVR